MMPQILSGYSVNEVMSSMQLCKDGIVCGSSRASSQLINNQTDIKLVLISDVLKNSGDYHSHSELRSELLELGWSDWRKFSFQEKYEVYGIIRSN